MNFDKTSRGQGQSGNAEAKTETPPGNQSNYKSRGYPTFVYGDTATDAHSLPITDNSSSGTW